MSAAEPSETSIPEVRMVVFAGPNGSGKSTAIEAAKQAHDWPFDERSYINADRIAEDELQAIEDSDARNLKAAQIATERRQAALASGKPFAYETVFSTPQQCSLITQARSRGYAVHVVFVTTDDPEINVRRVALRVALGGHPVPPDKIRSRYENAMLLMPHAVVHADIADCFDNSRDESFAELVASKERGPLRLRLDGETPDWVVPRLVLPYRDLELSRQRMTDEFERDATDQGVARQARLRDADASHGRRYEGFIVEADDRHVLQRLHGSGLYVLHDRVMLHRDLGIEPGRNASVVYAYEAGKLAPPLKPQTPENDPNEP